VLFHTQGMEYYSIPDPLRRTRRPRDSPTLGRFPPVGLIFSTGFFLRFFSPVFSSADSVFSSGFFFTSFFLRGYSGFFQRGFPIAGTLGFFLRRFSFLGTCDVPLNFLYVLQVHLSMLVFEC
jgi:hypothetical protein